MNYDVRLRIAYRYGSAVSGGRHLVRVMPPSKPGLQTVVAASLAVGIAAIIVTAATERATVLRRLSMIISSAALGPLVLRRALITGAALQPCTDHPARALSQIKD